MGDYRKLYEENSKNNYKWFPDLFFLFQTLFLPFLLNLKIKSVVRMYTAHDQTTVCVIRIGPAF